MTDPLNTMIQLLQILIPLIIGTILFSSTLLSKWKFLVIIVLILGISSPAFYYMVNEQLNPLAERSNDLELSMLFVWLSSALLIMLALARVYLKIKKSTDKKNESTF